VRHVRMLGLCLVAVFAVSAVFAGSALAKKDPYNVNTWGQYKYCPYENTELTDCFYGRTNGGKEGGEFMYGQVRVLLNKPIVIQGGYKGFGEEVEVSPAVNGGETLEDPEPEKIVKGLKTITPLIQEQAKWPQALMESYATAAANKETNHASLTVEMAGNECFEVPGCLNTGNLLFEEGTAFRLALKTTIHNAWLESLGGGPCTIGSDEHPIEQHLTSEGAGYVEGFHNNQEFTNLELYGTKLVDTTWHIYQASGASGCGNAEWESYIDKALNILLHVETPGGHEPEANKSGITWLTGNLHDANRKAVAKAAENGEV
jgi:hypothetical protein